MSAVRVSLGSRSYDVLIGVDLLSGVGGLIRKKLGKHRYAIVTDSNVASIHLPKLVESMKRESLDVQEIVVPAGEPSKSMTVAEQVCEAMAGARHDRSSVVVALGGGVIGDLAGFVAAIYYRGIPFVQLPTTVMAQVDSAVGGKTGVNLRKAKNLVGSFHQPSLVIADIDTLLTLPDRALYEGFAEVIKHGIIRDRNFFFRLAGFRRELDTIRGGSPDHSALAAVIQRNVEIKAAIVSEDEHETRGIRALLNFGHTIGHAIEAVAGYGELLHGEAISLGMVAAANLSVSHAGLPEAERDAIHEMLRCYELPTRPEKPLNVAAIMEALLLDKKFASGEVRYVLTPSIGSSGVYRTVRVEDIRWAIESLSR